MVSMCYRAMSSVSNIYKKASLSSSLKQSSVASRLSSTSMMLNCDDLDWSKHQNSFSPLFQFNIVSFNLLAPVYKRLQSVDITTGFRKRESQKEELWSARALRTADFFRREVLGSTDIIGLQEFWLDSAYRHIFEEEFAQAGYDVHVLKRPGKKLDGVALVIKSQDFEVLGTEHVFLSTLGDRVALLLWLKHRESGKDILIANTHLSFPHSTADRLDQMTQMQNLTGVIDSFAHRYHIDYATRVIMGDFNVESKSPVCNHLRSVGYASCFEVSPPTNADVMYCQQLSPATSTPPSSPPSPPSSSPSSSQLAASKPEDSIVAEVRFISHRNHRAEDLGVDHIFIRPEDGMGADTAASELMYVEKKESAQSSEDEYPRCDVPSSRPPAEHSDTLDHISRHTKLFIDNCYVLPKHRNCGLWDEHFLISDHRPVGATLVFTTPNNSEGFGDR